MIVQVLL